mmetsp:Transcript_9435/g.16023  ORF Transcript_9435/g.16023 Transcript_9435/m.16023 type:complete len:227 (+) Transcript_9435:446-1126(+)
MGFLSGQTMTKETKRVRCMLRKAVKQFPHLLTCAIVFLKLSRQQTTCNDQIFGRKLINCWLRYSRECPNCGTRWSCIAPSLASGSSRRRTQTVTCYSFRCQRQAILQHLPILQHSSQHLSQSKATTSLVSPNPRHNRLKTTRCACRNHCLFHWRLVRILMAFRTYQHVRHSSWRRFVSNALPYALANANICRPPIRTPSSRHYKLYNGKLMLRVPELSVTCQVMEK